MEFASLPISARKNQIIAAVKAHPVVIISGETGSGKTTQIPKFCLEAGRGRKGIIGCTQPRRIAAVNVARRIAEELGESLGQSVGYKIRFDDKTGRDIKIKLMTDGVLLAETQSDRNLKQYDTLIVDEAHERSLNIDFTLGILRQLVRKRKDLKLIITSATIDTEKFSKAFNNAPVIEVSGRMFPVQTIYQPFLNPEDDRQDMDEQGYVEAAADCVNRLIRKNREGDLLVFMPTEQDIGETLEIIRAHKHVGVTALPLFARLSAKEQSKIFSRHVGRKVIVSTNVAETSLTIPGIKYVVDTGLARIPKYSPRTRTTELPVSPVSQSSANQRQGRCGRVENGICIRLYSETDFDSRPFFTAPEILRSNLAEVILRMISLHLGDVASFPFIDAPNPKSIRDGYDTLVELGAIRQATPKKEKKAKKKFVLTPTGKLMAKLPIDPKLSRILIEADRRGCLKEAIIITTCLAVSDPRQRPSDKTQAADQKHALFKDPASDFITLLNIWNAVKNAEKKLKSRNQLKKFCQDHFLSFKRIREWSDIHRQITNMLKDYGIKGGKRIQEKTGSKGLKSKEFQIGGPLYAAIHKSLLAGYLAHIAHKKENRMFSAAKGQQAMIFPGSGLFSNPGQWIVAAEFVKTSQLFARTVANVDPAWIEEIAGPLLSRSYSEPHWEKKAGQVMATEQVSLFGLILAGDRKIAYGKINPEESSDIFIRCALVAQEINRQFDFLHHNQKLIKELESVEDKTRKKEFLASEEQIVQFYKNRLPKPFFNLNTFARFIKESGDQNFLKMKKEDLQQAEIDAAELENFPDMLKTENSRFKLAYCFSPGSSKDGVTVKVPASKAALISRETIERMVPGLFAEKIEALIKNLPKKYRIQLMPVSQTAAEIARQMPQTDAALFSQLSKFIKESFGIMIPADQWSDKELPQHLKMRISIRDRHGKELKSSRDTAILSQFKQKTPIDEDTAFLNARQKFEIKDISAWDMGEIQDAVSIGRSANFQLKGYPGLKVESSSKGKVQINFTLFRTASQRKNEHPEGVRQLFLKQFPGEFKSLKKDITANRNIRDIAVLFSGQTKFQAAMFDQLTRHLFRKNIRSQSDFETLAQKHIPGLYTEGQTYIQEIIVLGNAYKACFDMLQKLGFSHQKKPKTSAILSSLFQDLKNLIPTHFTQLYSMEQTRQLHRYAEALKIRAQRAADSPVKDEKKYQGVKNYIRHLNRLLGAITPQTSDDKVEKIEAFHWLIEEYKISVFAPEIKTRTKISAKILDTALADLATMI